MWQYFYYRLTALTYLLLTYLLSPNTSSVRALKYEALILDCNTRRNKKNIDIDDDDNDVDDANI